MAQLCTLCAHFGLPARSTSGILQVETRLAALGAERDGEKSVVAVPSCPEHAVAIYRGQVAGVEMSWRFVAPTG